MLKECKIEKWSYSLVFMLSSISGQAVCAHLHTLSTYPGSPRQSLAWISSFASWCLSLICHQCSSAVPGLMAIGRSK